MAADRGREHAVADENDERHRHEDRAQFQHVRKRMRLVGADELRQEGEEEDRQFRIEDVDQDRRRDHLRGRARRDVPFSTLSAPLPQRVPGHVEQVGDAEIFQRLEGERAGVQQRRQAGIAAAICGTMPSVQPNAAMSSRARRAKARPPACRERRCRAKPRRSATSGEIQGSWTGFTTAASAAVALTPGKVAALRTAAAAGSSRRCSRHRPSVPPRGSRRAAPGLAQMRAVEQSLGQRPA